MARGSLDRHNLPRRRVLYEFGWDLESSELDQVMAVTAVARAAPAVPAEGAPAQVAVADVIDDVVAARAEAAVAVRCSEVARWSGG